MVSCIQAFRIDFPRATGPNQTPAAHPGGSGKADCVQDGGRDVKQTGGFIHAAPRNSAPRPRRPVNDEGHMERTLVDEIAVSALAMLSQALSMVGGEHDQRLFEK